jgi:rod shape-determining protein MreC
VAGVLVLLSIVLITIYFREPAHGGLHRVQGAGATVLRPFEVAAERVARPFRDAYGYLSGLVHAKSQNARLRKQVDRYRQQAIQNETAVRENSELRRLLRFRDAPAFPQDYRGVAARVIARAPTQFQQQIGISAGSTDGIRLQDPVVTSDGLVGQVTKVAGHAAQVTLLTDETSAVSAVDLQSGAPGIVRHGQGSTSTLIVDRVTKDQVVNEGDAVVTAGWRSGKLSSLYPKGIPIGTVTSVGQNNIDLFKQIEIQPFVNFSSVNAVLVLVPKKPFPKVP